MSRGSIPNSKSGRLRALLAKRAELTTSEAARILGVPGSIASALLNQLRRRGEARQVSRGNPGRNVCQSAIWAAP